MALMKDGLWSIVSGSERPSNPANANKHTKLAARRDHALATIVLSVESSLLYLIGDPKDPIIVWQKVADQFQKKTWANKLKLRRKLYSLRLKGGCVQEHIKAMTELFDALSVVGDPVPEEDRVVHLLASLLESYNMLVTILEVNTEVPKMELVTEWLLHEERKLKDCKSADVSSDKAMTAKQPFKKGPKCHYCGKFGHIRRNCRKFAQENKSHTNDKEKTKTVKHRANTVETKQRDSSSSDSD